MKNRLQHFDATTKKSAETLKVSSTESFASEWSFQMKHPFRMVTATTLFDGHDVTINMLRRLLQAAGVEVIHMGHNRSVEEIVKCAVQEDAQAIVITSCQGGHMQFFKYMYDLLQKEDASHIKIFGGGGTIHPDERDALRQYGITQIYSPDDSRNLGLEGMIKDLISKCEIRSIILPWDFQSIQAIEERRLLASVITVAENNAAVFDWMRPRLAVLAVKTVPVVGLTGTGGAGKSSLIDELIRYFLAQFQDKRIAVVCVDPSRQKSGGALLSDSIRINMASHANVTIRSVATRSGNNDMMAVMKRIVEVYKAARFDLIIIETPGMGQSDLSIVDYSDICMYVMTSEFGAISQLEKINMLDYADIIVMNKFSKHNSLGALDQVKQYYKNNHQEVKGKDVQDIPIIATNASVFNDAGVKRLYSILLEKIRMKTSCLIESGNILPEVQATEPEVIPLSRAGYLFEIVDTLRGYNNMVKEQTQLARQLFQLNGTKAILNQQPTDHATSAILRWIETTEKDIQQRLTADSQENN